MLKFKTDSLPKSLSNKVLSPALVGKYVALQPPVLSDYPRWMTVRERNREFLKPYEPQWSDDALSLEFFKRRLQRQNQERASRRGAFFLIHHLDSAEIIGGINLNNIQMGAARHASLGYWLDESSQGNGYMREAANLVIDYAFDILKLKRLNAACLIDNKKSINLLNALSFEEEGLAKNYLQINGYWQDHRLFGLCASGQS